MRDERGFLEVDVDPVTGEIIVMASFGTQRFDDLDDPKFMEFMRDWVSYGEA